MRRDVLQQRQPNLCKLFRCVWLQAFALQFLCLCQQVSQLHRTRRVLDGTGRKPGHTSMSKSLSILTASPNKLIYCARLANCHMLRSVCSVLGASTGSSASISSRARFRAGIVRSVPGATRRKTGYGAETDDLAEY